MQGYPHYQPYSIRLGACSLTVQFTRSEKLLRFLRSLNLYRLTSGAWVFFWRSKQWHIGCRPSWVASNLGKLKSFKLSACTCSYTLCLDPSSCSHWRRPDTAVFLQCFMWARNKANNRFIRRKHESLLSSALAMDHLSPMLSMLWTLCPSTFAPILTYLGDLAEIDFALLEFRLGPPCWSHLKVILNFLTLLLMSHSNGKIDQSHAWDGMEPRDLSVRGLSKLSGRR